VSHKKHVDSQLAPDSQVFLGVHPVSDEESKAEKGSKKKATAKKKVALPERRTDDLLKEELRYLNAVVRHIKLVQDGAHKLGMALIERGETDLGRILIANSLIHDNSKFYGIEWECLHENATSDQLKLAHRQHVKTNAHHPEYWGGVDQMPRVYIAEMVCDWKARSDEFASDLRKWIKEEAFERFSIAPRGKVARQIKEFVDLLVEKPFKHPNAA